MLSALIFIAFIFACYLFEVHKCRKNIYPPTTGYIFGHLKELKKHGFINYLSECSKQYGSVFCIRFGPPVVGKTVFVVTDPVVAKEIIVEDNNRPLSEFVGGIPVFGHYSLFGTNASDPFHGLLRNVTLQHLSTPYMALHGRYLMGSWEQWCQQNFGKLNGDQAVELDLFDPTMRHVQKNAIYCWFGIDPSKEIIDKALLSYFKAGSVLSWIFTETFPFDGIGRRTKTVQDFVRAIFEEHLVSLINNYLTLENPSDAFQGMFVINTLKLFNWDIQRLVSDQDYFRKLMRDDELLKNFYSGILPATGSISGTILFILMELGIKPDLQQQLREELQNYDPVTDRKIPTLIKNVIKESTRLYPVAMAVTKITSKERKYKTGVIPSESIALIPLSALHRNPLFWDNPDEFNPSRFQQDSPLKQGHYAGFSHGKLSCIGKSFAEFQVAIFFKVFLSSFEIITETKSPIEDNDYRTSVTLQPRSAIGTVKKLEKIET